MSPRRRPLVRRLALLGIGLIGSSVARAARRAKLAGEIVCYSRRAETRKSALKLGVVDRAYADPAEAVDGADMVVLCVHLGAYLEVGRRMAPALAKGAIVTDVGSTKQSVIRDLKPLLPKGVHLVPGHPVAGTEHSGPAAGFAELFDNRWCILTPAAKTAKPAVNKVTQLWRGMGAHVQVMDARHHDLVLAITSHLPHLIAYNIVGTAADLEQVTKSEVIKYSAGGFRDFTRIAASDPVFWRDVFLNNKDAVLEVLGRFTEDLHALQRAIRWSDGQSLESLFTRTRAIRRGIIQAGQETAAPDFGRLAAASKR